MATDGRYDEHLALAVAMGATVRDAAAQVGVSERQAYRLNATKAFRDRVAEIRTEIQNGIVGRLIDAGEVAVRTLVDACQDTEAKPSERIAAAKAILTSIGPMSESLELRQRLESLEGSSNDEFEKAA